MSSSEKTVIYGLGALIAWELWRCCHPETGEPMQLLGQTATPVWVQQLSQMESGEDYFTLQSGMYGRCYR